MTSDIKTIMDTTHPMVGITRRQAIKEGGILDPVVFVVAADRKFAANALRGSSQPHVKESLRARIRKEEPFWYLCVSVAEASDLVPRLRDQLYSLRSIVVYAIGDNLTLGSQRSSQNKRLMGVDPAAPSQLVAPGESPRGDRVVCAGIPVAVAAPRRIEPCARRVCGARWRPDSGPSRDVLWALVCGGGGLR